MKHTVIAALVLVIGVAGSGPEAFGAEHAPRTKTIQAEVQIGLCSPIDHIVRALDLRARGAPINVWHFDDPAMALYARGLRLRLRVATDGRSEFTLKMTNQDCARLDPKHVPPGGGKCEYDVYGTTTAGAVSLTSKMDAKTTSALVTGRMAPASAMNPSQIRYLREVVGAWPLPDGLRRLGPMQVQMYRTARGRYDVDTSHLPNGEQYAEISAKVAQPDAISTMEVMKAELQRAGVEMCADQSSQIANKLRALLR